VSAEAFRSLNFKRISNKWPRPDLNALKPEGMLRIYQEVVPRGVDIHRMHRISDPSTPSVVKRETGNGENR
jgi:hypothetical protein